MQTKSKQKSNVSISRAIKSDREQSQEMKKLGRQRKRELREISPVRLHVKSLLAKRLKDRLYNRLRKLRKLQRPQNVSRTQLK
jgi:hypothetical protein